MIAFSKLPSGPSHKQRQEDFLAMLPTIRHYATLAFRQLRGDDGQEVVQEVVANAYVAYWRLVQKNRAQLAYPTVLARYAIAQVRAGRRVGGSLRVRDVLSSYAQRRKQFSVERLERFDYENRSWVEAVVEDPRTPVFDQVCFRIDFSEWLSRLSLRRKRIAEMLSLGHSTQEVAQRFSISSARVSQLRRDLHHSWHEFQGDLDSVQDDKDAAAATPVPS